MPSRRALEIPLALVLGTCVLVTAATTADAAPGISVADLLAVKWINQLDLAPDGKRVAFVVTTADRTSNKKHSKIFLATTAGPLRLRQLTNNPASDSAPAFSPDGKRLAFISSRAAGGTPQIWIISLSGGEATQLSTLSTGAGGPLVWSPDGKLIAFVSSVYPDCKDDACNKQRSAAQDKSEVKAQVFDALMIRHWNAWRDARRDHIFVVQAQGPERGKARDLTGGPHDAPPIALGGSPDYAFSPDSKLLAYVTNTDKHAASSTNNDVFELPLAGGPPRRISAGQGNDNTPRYSPDGRYLAYLSMERPGYESDRPRIMVRDRKGGQTVEWSRGFDGHPLGLRWAPTSARLYFSAPSKGYVEVFAADGRGVRQIGQRVYATELAVTPDDKTLVLSHQAADRPPELYAMTTGGKGLRALTRLNDWVRTRAGLLSAEHHWFEGAAGHKIHAVLIKPPGFRKGARYPALVMIHGGPQGMTGDDFHPRWNLQMFASRGYVVFGINFHGSVGFGQPFTDSIRGDWGGKPYTDVLRGTDYLERLPFVRKGKICAAGASYGGYMVNWIATQTRRFACLISHAGVYNIESKYGSTEELWFPEWDIKGTPWTNRADYRRWSPHSYAEKLATPTLVIHGQRDYRVPVEQGLQLFTALQRQKIPSRLLYFPDEDHFVKKPQNIELWWKTMHDWLGRYLR